MRYTIQLVVERKVLICGEKQALLGHHMADKMLAALIEAANRSQSLRAVELVQLWHQHSHGALPDRTAIARSLQAVQIALSAVLPNGESRVTYAARQKTVGPWRLNIAADEMWQVHQQSTASAAPTSCVLQFCESTDNWATAAQALALADDFMSRGKYTECREILIDQLQRLPLTPSAQCLWTLRIVRCCLRMGDGVAAKLWAEKIPPLVARLQGVFARHVAAELALLQQRWKFNDQPVASSSEISLVDLIASAQSAPSALLLAQAENLKGLALRRLLAKRLTQKIDLAEDVKSVMATTSAAYFWACIAQDGYYQQAVATNMGYLLHWLGKHKLQADRHSCLRWFALARTLVDRFELPQDSAWDYVMVGTAYMESVLARAELKTLAAAWPDAEGPDTEAFYTRGVQLAQEFGDARQRILTLGLLVQHYQLAGCLTKLTKTKADWAQEKKANAEIFKDMELDI